MKNKYTIEIVFLLLVIALSPTGFSSLFLGERAPPGAHHIVHIVTSLG